MRQSTRTLHFFDNYFLPKKYGNKFSLLRFCVVSAQVFLFTSDLIKVLQVTVNRYVCRESALL